MRIPFALAFVLAVPTPAHADECADETAPSVDCNALDKRGAMSMSSGWSAMEFDPAGHTFDVKRVGYVNTIGQFDGRGLEPIHGNGFFLDVRIHATPHWYAGVDVGAAWGSPPGATFATRGGAMIAWDRSMVFAMAGVAGARVPLGRFSLRGELVAGLHGAALVTMSDAANPISAEAMAPLVEPRIAADVWLHRWWVLEAFAGTNALDRSERTFGIGLGFHSQAFDGHY